MLSLLLLLLLLLIIGVLALTIIKFLIFVSNQIVVIRWSSARILIQLQYSRVRKKQIDIGGVR
jgi:hypothetical protein